MKNHYETVPTTSGGSRVRQAPGPDNALGGVKFLFPNEYNVYLHGTPALELFSKSRRDFSHGCIRVEKPEELATWVLRNKPEWTRERIREAMNSAQSLRVNLDTPIPVLIVYGTTVVAGDGDILRRYLRVRCVSGADTRGWPSRVDVAFVALAVQPSLSGEDMYVATHKVS